MLAEPKPSSLFTMMFKALEVLGRIERPAVRQRTEEKRIVENVKLLLVQENVQVLIEGRIPSWGDLSFKYF